MAGLSETKDPGASGSFFVVQCRDRDGEGRGTGLWLGEGIGARRTRKGAKEAKGMAAVQGRCCLAAVHVGSVC